MNRGDSLAALEGLVGNHDHHHGQLVPPLMYVCIRRHGSDVYLGMSPVQNGGSYLMY